MEMEMLQGFIVVFILVILPLAAAVYVAIVD